MTLNPDGTADNTSNGMKGTWVFTNNAEVQRKYTLVWNEGQFIDKGILSEDHNTLQIKNQKGGAGFTARRAIKQP